MLSPPSVLVIWSSKARGGFIEVVCLGTLALLVTVLWLRDKSYTRTLLIGMLLGFGWWVNNQIVYFMPPIGLWMLLRLSPKISSIISHFVLGAFGFLLGGLPFWLYNLSNDFVSFEMFHATDGEGLLEHFTGLFSTALPILLGGKRYWQSTDIFPLSSVVVLSLYVALLIFLVFSRKKQLANILKGKVAAEHSVELIFLVIITTLAVFSLSSFGYLVEAPRYLLPLYTSVFILSGVAIASLWEKIPTLAFMALTGILIFNLLSSYLGGRAIPGEPFVFDGDRVSRDHAALIDWLEEKEFDWVRTNYWIGYRLAFETKEKVRFLVWQKPGQVRIKNYEQAVSDSKRDLLPLILVPKQATHVKTALETLGYQYKTESVSGYSVVYDLKPPHEGSAVLNLKNATAAASHSSDKALSAIDGDKGTRWGSAAPQSKDMSFSLNLAKPELIHGLHYVLADWRHDFPRGLKVELVNPNGGVIEVLTQEQFKAISYYLSHQYDFSFYFEPQVASEIRLKLQGEHPILDWSIAELEVLG